MTSIENNQFWPETHDPEDYNYTDLEELEGWRVGELVEVLEDTDESFEGDVGTIIGFCTNEPGAFNPNGSVELILHSSGRDPFCVDPLVVGIAD